MASFALATGLYNISYYGNSSELYWGDPLHYGHGDRSAEANRNLDLAQKYYVQAMNLSKDAEFKARACFMAAKTEHHQKDNADYPHWQYERKVDFVSGRYFKILKTEYSKTQYYQEALRECGYFSTYVNAK